MRPIAGARHQPVLHRIEVNVIGIPGEVALVADRVLPIQALPNPLFALADF